MDTEKKIIELLQKSDIDARHHTASLARIWIRFQEHDTAQLGEKLSIILDSYLDLIQPGINLWYMTSHQLEGKQKFMKKGKTFLDHLKIVSDLLKRFKKMPEKDQDDQLYHFLIKDGLCPAYASESGKDDWQPGCLIPKKFEFKLSIETPGSWYPGGHLEMCFPLQDLKELIKREKWIKLGLSAFESLKANIGGINPALIYCNGHQNIPLEFFTKFPHFHVPCIIQDRGFYCEDFSPNIFETSLTPNWLTFLNPKLMNQVSPSKFVEHRQYGGYIFATKEPIFEINNNGYEVIKDFLKKFSFLSPKKWAPMDEARYPYQLLFDLFKSSSLGELKQDLRERMKEHSQMRDFYKKTWKLNQAKKYEEALAESEMALSISITVEFLSVGLDSLTNIVSTIDSSEELVIKWVRRISENEEKLENHYLKEQVYFDLFKCLVIVNRFILAQPWLEKIMNNQELMEEIDKASCFENLRLHPDYRLIVGKRKLPLDSSYFISEEAVLSFPKICTRINRKPEHIYNLNNGVRLVELKRHEKKLNIQFPSEYATFLSYWNGGFFANEIYFPPIEELIKNIVSNEDLYHLNIADISNTHTITSSTNGDEKVVFSVTQNRRVIKSSKSLDSLVNYVIKSLI